MSKKKTVFISQTSYEDAILQAKLSGYNVVGKGRNKKKEYVVFARKSGII